jgi:hypothetical protein
LTLQDDHFLDPTDPSIFAIRDDFALRFFRKLMPQIAKGERAVCGRQAPLNA